jgi:hypothetical protein
VTLEAFPQRFRVLGPTIVAAATLLFITPVAARARQAATAAAATTASASGMSYPARVDDFATCDMNTNKEGWTQAKNYDLSTAFNRNDWDGVEGLIANFFATLKCTRLPVQRTATDKRQDRKQRPARDGSGALEDLVTDDAYLSVLFLDETLPTPTLERVVFHWYNGLWRCVPGKDSDLPEVYSSRIGAYEFYELRLLPAGVFAVTQYNVGTSPNTLVTQIPGALTTVAAKVIIPGPAAAAAGGGAEGSIPKASPLELFGLKEVIKTAPSAAPAPPTFTECDDIPSKPFPLPKAATIFDVRRIMVPRAFRLRIPWVVPSVIPTVSITDQLPLSGPLEDYLLTVQRNRDAAVTGADEIERRLFAAYVHCRMPIGLDVSTDAASYSTTQLPVVIARVRFPAAVIAVARRLLLHFTVTPSAGGTPVLDTFKPLPYPPPKGPIAVCPRLGMLAVGIYQARVDVVEDPYSAVPPPIASANTVFSVDTSKHDPESLVLQSYSVPLGTALMVAPIVSTFETGRLKILDVASGNELMSIATSDVAKNPWSIDTSRLGVGDRLAVVEDKDNNATTVYARTEFTITERAPALAAVTPAAGAACLALDDDILSKIYGSQATTSLFTDLYSTYAGLLTLASPTGGPAPTPAQYTLGPLTRFSLSLGIGASTGTFIHTPAAPPTQPASWIALDIHPWAYDETRYSPTLAERFRFFTGLALTPDVGVVAGAGFGLVRGLSLEGGVGTLIGTIKSDPTQPACTPMRSNHHMCPSAPTARQALGIAFVGLGYSLQ